MLTCLRVRSFAIIDGLELQLEPGLNVVTGETGAGKSILVDALGLVLGGRGRPEVVRTGSKSAEVEALFDVSEQADLLEAVESAGLAAGDELVVRRVVLASGRTRAYVNGHLATAAQLGSLAVDLADISSQHEHHSLRDPARQLEYLDAFAKLSALRSDVRRAHARLGSASRSLDDLRERARDKGDREDLLRYQVGEITEIDPQLAGDSALVEERERLRHAERLARAADEAHEELYARDGALCEQLGRIGAEVQEAGRHDPLLAQFAAQVDEARAQLEDAARGLGGYARRVTLDPARLAEVEARLDAIHRLERKYGGSIEAVLAHRDAATAELESLVGHEERLQRLCAERDAALAEARDIARRLSERRKRFAKKLGAAIGEELSSLGMGEARVRIRVAPLQGGPGELSVDGARLSPTGIDGVQLLIATNRGEDARPLRQIASGGELSRAMLAVKRVLAGLRPAGLYVFDEVDAGVGGAVAEVIGKKLRDIARHHQVLCITHLPQIAVYADAHFRVHKDVVGERTHSFVSRLTAEQRLEEIARMLGGIEVTRKTRAAAGEMLKGARPPAVAR